MAGEGEEQVAAGVGFHRKETERGGGPHPMGPGGCAREGGDMGVTDFIGSRIPTKRSNKRLCLPDPQHRRKLVREQVWRRLLIKVPHELPSHSMVLLPYSAASMFYV